MEDILYPDNDHREERCIQLVEQCAQFQGKLCQVKTALEAAAKEASEAVYEAYEKVEPGIPEYQDWSVKTKIVDGTVMFSDVFPWVLDGAAFVASLFVSVKVYKALKPLLESCHCFRRAVERAESVASEAAVAVRTDLEKSLAVIPEEEIEEEVSRASAQASQEAIDSVTSILVTTSEMPVTETTLTMTGKVVSTVVSGAAAVVATAAIVIIVDLVAEAISGALKRDKYREVIKDSYKARLQLKTLDLQYAQLMEELQATVKAFKATAVVQDAITKEQLDTLCASIQAQHEAKVADNTEEKARKELAALDKAMGAWTNEDEGVY